MDSFVETVLTGLAAYWFVGLVVYVLLVIADWKILEKAGEKGWKSLIPVYNLYVQFKVTWGAKFYWIWFALVFAAGICQAIDADIAATLFTIFDFAQGVVLVIAQYKLAKAFGHGVGFTIGLILIPNLFTLILGFGKSKYVGVQG